MTRIGKNLRVSIDESYRPRVRALFAEVLGASVVNPPGNAGLEVYKLAGVGVGVFYVQASEALAPSDHLKATWLEFEVAEPASTAKQLDALGVERIDYADKAHAYYQIPGGPVFRLAKLD